MGTVLTSSNRRGTPRYSIVPLLTVGVPLGTVLHVFCQYGYSWVHYCTDSVGTPGYSIVPLLIEGYCWVQYCSGTDIGRYSWVQYCTSAGSRGTPGYSNVPLLTVGVLLGPVLTYTDSRVLLGTVLYIC